MWRVGVEGGRWAGNEGSARDTALQALSGGTGGIGGIKRRPLKQKRGQTCTRQLIRISFSNTDALQPQPDRGVRGSIAYTTSMEFVALGSTEAIGASCLFLNINDTGIVLDAGADPEEEGVESLPRLDLLRRNSAWYVDHVIVTHAHHDHMGSLPVLLREYPNVNVHMSPATRQLADLLLPASARLQRRKLKEGSSAHEPLFSEEELDMQSFLYLTHELHESFDLRGIRDKSPFRGEFYNAGHVLGSVGVQMTFEEEGRRRRMFYSSDTNSRPQDIIPGGDYPEGPVDILILESTLGADPEAEKTTRKLEEDRFANALARVLDRFDAVGR